MIRQTGTALILCALLFPMASAQAHSPSGSSPFRFNHTPGLQFWWRSNGLGIEYGRINTRDARIRHRQRQETRHLKRKFLSDGYLSRRELRILEHKRERFGGRSHRFDYRKPYWAGKGYWRQPESGYRRGYSKRHHRPGGRIRRD